MNPVAQRRAAIMGMFVIRPGIDHYQSPLPRVEDGEAVTPLDTDTKKEAIAVQSMNSNGMYEEYDWIFSVNGIEGGGLISGFNSLDAYRLALHYGISDAVIFGTHHVAHEGISDDALGTEGYLWLPDTVCAWDNLQAADSNLTAKIYEQRQQYQQLGLLSTRKYPAQIAFTWTAAVHEGCEVCIIAHCSSCLSTNRVRSIDRWMLICSCSYSLLAATLPY